MSAIGKTPPPFDPVPALRKFLGDAVFIAWPRGVKGARKKWRHLRQRDMTPEYLAKLRNGNIGVALGEISNGLCALDIDDDQHVEPFITANPNFAKTFQTHGSRGRVFWFRLKGRSPHSRKLQTASGVAIGEFRSDGNQSIVWGIHPSTKKPYVWLKRCPAIEIELSAIQWPVGIVNPFLIKSPDTLPRPNLPEGASLEGRPRREAPLICSGGVVVVDGSLSADVREKIEQAVTLGVQATSRNNMASFQAAVTLVRLLGVENLHDLKSEARSYFAARWYDRLNSLGRINPDRTKTHYFNDVMSAIKNANSNSQSNPIPHAWQLAQSEALPPEAELFGGDKVMQDLIALCYQLHRLTRGGEFFLARNVVGKLMKLDETATRNLSENFQVLVGCGILEIVTPYEKGTRQATVYRFISREREPGEIKPDGSEP